MPGKQRKWSKEEIEFLKQNYGQILVKEIIAKTGFTYGQIVHQAKYLGLKSSLSKNNCSSIQQKNLAAIKTRGFQLLDGYKNVKNKSKFLCRCGKEFISTIQHIVSGHTSSCGCESGFNRRKGTNLVSGTYYTTLKNSASLRLLDFNISIEYITFLLQKQNFKCALSGLEIECGYKNSHSASLDRIDNTKGYTEDNVQWLHKDVNFLKNRMKQEKFIFYCKEIAKTNKD
jgi:hypothetical protein